MFYHWKKILFGILIVSFSFFHTGSCSGDEKGYLLIIGGGTRTPAMMKLFIKYAESGNSEKIIIIPSASAEPRETGEYQANQLRDLGAKNVEYLIIEKDRVNDPEIINRLQNTGGIFFSGGDQSRLTNLFKGTLVEETFHKLYKSGTIFGGTSAGAAVMSKIMITGDEKKPLSEDDAFEIISRDNIVTVEGFGFIKSALIDQHFIRRKRHNRLISLIIENPDVLGIGIDESTAIFVHPDDTFEVIGKNQVVIYDASEAKTGNNGDLDRLSAAGIKMHILTEGYKFDLKEKKVTSPKSLKKENK